MTVFFSYLQQASTKTGFFLSRRIRKEELLGIHGWPPDRPEHHQVEFVAMIVHQILKLLLPMEAVLNWGGERIGVRVLVGAELLHGVHRGLLGDRRVALDAVFGFGATGAHMIIRLRCCCRCCYNLI